MKPKVEMSGIRWRSIGAYCLAALLIWYSARGTDLRALIHDFRRADLKLFLPVSLGGFMVWFFGENLLFSRLFSYFHKRTGFRELLPANATHYFLQLTNLAVASGALLFFLNRRKGVSWSAGGFTLIFQGLLDVTLLAAMSVAAVMLGLHSPLKFVAPYAAAMALGGLVIAVWFLYWIPKSGPARWIYDRPALSSFKSARLWHYGRLTAIRMPIFLAEGFILYGELRSFHVHLSLFQALLFSPVSMLIGSIPIAPVGLGTLQLVFVKGLTGSASQADLLAAALAISFINLVWRIPLGILSVGPMVGGAARASETSCATA